MGSQLFSKEQDQKILQNFSPFQQLLAAEKGTTKLLLVKLTKIGTSYLFIQNILPVKTKYSGQVSDLKKFMTLWAHQLSKKHS